MNIVLSKTEVNGKLIETTNGRDLQRELQNTNDYSQWIKRVTEAAYLVENVDFIVIRKNAENSTGGRPLKEYHLTVESAKSIAMMQRSEIGKRVRDYYIELEKQSQAQPKLTSIQMLAQMANDMAEQEQKQLELEANQQMIAESVLEVAKAQAETTKDMYDLAKGTGTLLNNLAVSTQEKLNAKADFYQGEECPVGYSTMSHLKDRVDEQLSDKMFEYIASWGNVDTHNYTATTPTGHPIPATAYNLAQLRRAVARFIRQSDQVTPCKCVHIDSPARFSYVK